MFDARALLRVSKATVLPLLVLVLLTACGARQVQDSLTGSTAQRLVSYAIDDLARRLSTAVNGPVRVCPGGPERVRRLGIVSGGAGGDVAKAAALGADTFLTGEAPHWAYTLAEEEGVNLLLGGHYATETFGVKALAAKAADHFGIPWRFLDHPTGL